MQFFSSPDRCTSVLTPELAKFSRIRVPGLATEWHLRRALQSPRTRTFGNPPFTLDPTFFIYLLLKQAIPDVAAQSESFRIFLGGRAALIGGTSAAAPSFAAFVALLNDARIAEGKPPLGFLNPLIYALKGEGFNDITVGNAPGCGTPGFNVGAFCESCELSLSLWY